MAEEKEAEGREKIAETSVDSGLRVLGVGPCNLVSGVECLGSGALGSWFGMLWLLWRSTCEQQAESLRLLALLLLLVPL